MAIRTRILAVVLSLVAIALVVLDVVSYSAVRNSLVSSAQSQLQTSSHRFFGGLYQAYETNEPALSSCDGLPYGAFGAFYTTDGKSAPIHGSCTPGKNVTPPVLPHGLVKAVSAKGGDAVFASVGSFEVEARFEDLSAVSPSGPLSEDVIFVVGEPLSPLNSTLGNVLLLEILVTGSILVVAGVAAYFLVNLGLRPLEKMAGTAGEIAAGDLSRRVDETDERTEVGRLGSSLNVMLSRIEQAFRDKEASEARLRLFVADASHELRTPLTSIRGYAELFGGGRPSSEADLAAALGRIESESARMSVLVDDLLLLARLDQGRPLDRAPVDLGRLIVEAAGDARVVAPERQISVAADGDLVAIGDDARLRQVLANLMSNALAHTEATSAVEITAERSGEKVRLAVIDHGPGIPPSLRSKVFDRFWRADESRQRAKGGSGLGLSLVAAIVEAHGGKVSIEETPGGGASFVVVLPAAGGGSRRDGGWGFEQQEAVEGGKSEPERADRPDQADQLRGEPDRVAWVRSSRPE